MPRIIRLPDPKLKLEFEKGVWHVYDQDECIFTGTQREVEEWLDWRDHCRRQDKKTA